MGIALFLLGILALAAAIGFAVLYASIILMLFALGIAYLVSIYALNAFLGEDYIMLSVVLAIPLGVLGIAAVSKIMNR